MGNISISGMINRLGRQMHSVLKNQERDFNITSTQIAVLMYIGQRLEEGIPVFQKDIEHEFTIKGSSVTSILNTLEKNKWIRREKVDYDARLKLIVLGEMACVMMDRMKEFWENIDTTIENTLSTAEQIVFRQCVEKIMNALPEEIQ